MPDQPVSLEKAWDLAHEDDTRYDSEYKHIEESLGEVGVGQKKFIARLAQFTTQYPEYGSNWDWNGSTPHGKESSIGQLVGDLSCIAGNYGHNLSVEIKAFGPGGLFETLKMTLTQLDIARTNAIEIIKSKGLEKSCEALDSLRDIFCYLEFRLVKVEA